MGNYGTMDKSGLVLDYVFDSGNFEPKLLTCLNQFVIKEKYNVLWSITPFILCRKCVELTLSEAGCW